MVDYSVQQRDIEYLQHGDVRLMARLYQPAGDGPFPAVVEVHGGAWTSNDRFSNVAIDATLAAAGIVVLALDFRMPPEGVYPDSVADVNFGIRWLKAHAAEFRSRADMVGGVGTSSGAQTLLMNVLRPHDPRYAAVPLAASLTMDATLDYVVACWPIANPLARYHMAKEKGNDRLVSAHDKYWPSEAAMAEGNPQLLLDQGGAGIALPPMLIVQGTKDDNVTPDMAANFANAYRMAGAAVNLRTFEGQPHSFIKEPLTPPAVHALEDIKGFILKRAFRARA